MKKIMCIIAGFVTFFIICGSNVYAFTDGSTIICESWERASNDSSHEDFWNFIPVNARDSFYVGESPIILSKIINPRNDFSWRTDLYRDGVLVEDLSNANDFVSAFYNVGDGWNQASFIPQLKNATKGSYVAKTWTDTDTGAVLVDEKDFKVVERPPLNVPDAVICEGIAPGSDDSGDSEYWNSKPINSATVFQPGTQIFLLINKSEIFEPHYWISYFYYGDAEKPFFTSQSMVYNPPPEGMRYSPWYAPLIVNELGSYTVETYMMVDGVSVVDSTVLFIVGDKTAPQPEPGPMPAPVLENNINIAPIFMLLL